MNTQGITHRVSDGDSIKRYEIKKTQWYAVYGAEGDLLGEFTDWEEALALAKKDREEWVKRIGFDPEDYL
jgi:hypothetical protein